MSTPCYRCRAAWQCVCAPYADPLGRWHPERFWIDAQKLFAGWISTLGTLLEHTGSLVRRFCAECGERLLSWHSAPICASCHVQGLSAKRVDAHLLLETKRQADRDRHRTDTVQPFLGGRPNPAYIKLYPKDAKKIFTKAERQYAVDFGTRSIVKMPGPGLEAGAARLLSPHARLTDFQKRAHAPAR